MRLKLMFVARVAEQPSAPTPPAPLHLPAMHVCPFAHAMPQPPQLASFIVVSTHAVPQAV